VGRRLAFPGGVRLADHAFSRFERLVGGDPRDTQPIATVGLLEDLPLLLVHGDADELIPSKAAARLAAAAPEGSRHLLVPGAGHGTPHATDPERWEAAASDLLRSAFGAARNAA
jgi:pimeloyl-ACP methyl ester carboxylesterase